MRFETTTIALWYKNFTFMYDFQTLWDNSGAPGEFAGGKDNWECWMGTWDNALCARGADGEDGRWDDGVNSHVEYSLANYTPFLDTWFHVTVTWAKNGSTMDMKEYINGVLVDDAPAQLWQPPGDEFYLGGGNDGNTFGVGIFDELGIWSRQLTDAEVMEVYTIGVAPGDANLDGDVDDEDASILGSHWQLQSGATWGMGDFNKDGKVNDKDAAIMAAHWTGTAGDASVPEPSTWALLLSILLCLACLRRRIS
ncbi:MAG: dockerin type I domain-containing protein [Planctomycetia bacterium]|nr:dockerin type I domain-containing protein [Planctomycetia bacterium]